MTDFLAAPGASPSDALKALEAHVPLRDEDRRLALAFMAALDPRDLRRDRPFTLDFAFDFDVTGEAAAQTPDPVALLVASPAFGQALASRLKAGERSAAIALVHLLMDRDRLRRVVEEAGLKSHFATFDWD